MVSGTGWSYARACPSMPKATRVFPSILGQVIPYHTKPIHTKPIQTIPIGVGAEPEKNFRSAPAIFAFFVENIGKAIRQEINRFTGVSGKQLCMADCRYPLFCVRMRCDAFFPFRRIIWPSEAKTLQNAKYSCLQKQGTICCVKSCWKGKTCVCMRPHATACHGR